MDTEVKLSPTAIVTYTGRVVEPLNPDPETINIVDIAHSLSNQCRFTGHTREFYSVAQHSYLVSQMVRPEDALWGLLHDASEAYLADLARPIKRAVGSLAEAYSQAERRLMHAISLKFELPREHFWYEKHGMPLSVKKADTEILFTEMNYLMPELLHSEVDEVLQQPEEEFVPWSPKNAKTNFLIMFAELTDNDMMID